MAVEVTRMIASVSCSILGSGTSSTRTSWLPCQVTAFMGVRATRGRRRQPLFGQYALGDRERRVGGGHAGVDRGVQQHLADLLRGEAVRARGAHVHRDLVLASERGQD